MPVIEFSERDRLVVDLALAIEDPAGIEAVELARVLLEIFGDRSPAQAQLMQESLYRWSLQWPRRRQATIPSS